jgi:hypothetical protein
MRIAVPLIAAVLLSVACLAQATESCVWTAPAKTPRLFLDGPVAHFKQYYGTEWANCAARGNEKRDVEVEWRFGADAARAPIDSDKVQLARGSRQPFERLQSKLFPNHVCDNRQGLPRGKLAVTGLPGEERVSELVPIRVTVKAEGSLAPLAYESKTIDFPCPACSHSSNRSLRVRSARGQNPVIEGKIDQTWFECARHGGTLALLGFNGQAENDVMKAIRPDLRLAGLEKEFVLQGNEYVLRKPIPVSRLCAKGARVWSFEFWGRGELMRAGGGGRSIHTVECP